MKHCDRYCGVACIDGTCPMANRDEYAERGYDVVHNCSECHYYNGCEDCAFDGTDVCIKEMFCMTMEDLNNLVVSQYNEDTEDQLDYYINELKCNVGDKAYLYSHADRTLSEMEIVHIITRSDNKKFYDNLSEDTLYKKESQYNADTSAEFITDNDCYLVWFKYI